MMHPAEPQPVISPSAIDLPPTQSVDITDWVAAGTAER
jgi:hypothetical protein